MFGVRGLGAGFRALVADGVITGLWLQACATARGDDTVAARCRAVIAGVVQEAARLTGPAPDELAGFVANGALVVMLQALGSISPVAAGGRRCTARGEDELVNPLLLPVVALQARWMRSTTTMASPADGPTRGTVGDGPGPPLRIGALDHSAQLAPAKNPLMPPMPKITSSLSIGDHASTLR